MSNRVVEMQGKSRRLFYAKVNLLNDDGSVGVPAGATWIASGGGALELLTGDDLIIATHNDSTAPARIGCLEEYYNPIPAAGKTVKPFSIDLTKVAACHIAVDNHRAAKRAEADFVFEKGITLFGRELATTAAFRHSLRIEVIQGRESERTHGHDAIIQAQMDLDALSKTFDDCCDELLISRDAAITYQSAL